MKEGISIIIPTLNEEKYVGKLLDCLTKQTYKDFEVIVVDGVSDDRTKKIVKDYKDRLNLKLINSEKRNVSYQRNLGSDRSGFHILLFLDADVSFDDNFLEKSLNYINNKNIDIASVRFTPTSKDFPEIFFFNLINVFFSVFQYIKPSYIGAGLFIKKKIFVSSGKFNEKLTFAEDLEFIRRAHKLKKFRILPYYVIFSTRRFDKLGSRNMIQAWIKTFIKHLLNKETPKPQFYDHVGGNL